MKYGKLTQTAWMRSVRRQLHIEEKERVFPPTPFESCSGLLCGRKGFVWADAHASGTSVQTGYYAVLKAAGELAAKGTAPEGVSVRILFPPVSEEKELKAVTNGIVAACDRLGLTVNSFQGETTCAAAGITVFVTAVALSPGVSGQTEDNDDQKNGGGQELLLCGYAGLEGTLRIIDAAEEELGTRFVSAFLAQAKGLSKDLVTPAQLLALQGTAGTYSKAAHGSAAQPGDTASCIGAGHHIEKAPDITAVRQITGGGILAALWELAETMGIGFEIDMSAISLKQETVEICEFYRLNPYQLTSAGSFLIVTPDALEVIRILEQVGARAIRLGVTKPQNARVITSGEEVRYLDRPAPDELESWLAGRIKTSGSAAGQDKHR